MNLRNGREFLAIPGPTNVPDAVLQAMHRPAVDIYSGEMVDITDSCQADIGKIFGTEGRIYLYAANGHGAWEAALTNVLSRGETVLVLSSGRFATGWGEVAAVLGCHVKTLSGNWRTPVDPVAVEDYLRKDVAGRIKAVLVVQVDTASGVVNDIPAIRKAMDAAGHNALLMVDAIASLATMAFEMDAWGVDVAISGSQKGLMTPPGLSFVASGKRGAKVHAKANLRTYYWDWTERDGALYYKKFCGTTPVHLMFGLRKALDLLLEEGLENVVERHVVLADAVRRAVGVWSESQAISFNIVKPSARANSVTTVLLADEYDPKAIQEFCRTRLGVILGGGLGELSGKAFRIAHMGHLNAPMVLGTLGAVESALQALAIPHGSGGIQAATDWIGKCLAV
jgi:alanine-glyoxylate transaminase/serine-glyoxylate transaminase/serine-pyruvate transaminase